MPLRDYWDILRHSRLLIITTTVVGILIALGFSLRTTPVYQAQAQLFVSVRATDGIADAYTGGLYLQQRIKSYTTVVDTPGVLEPAAQQLGDSTAGELADQVSVESPSGTVLLNVIATDTDPQKAARIADATAASLAKEIVRLESTSTGVKPVKVELIRPAGVPSSPVAPRTKINLAIGTILGLLLGAGISVLRATLDTSIKSTEDLQDATQAVLLASIAYDSGAAKKPLVMMQGSPRSEAYRSMRTNLQYVDVDHPPKSLVITSCVPLEGKSTTAANLAIALAQGGSKVLLIEADLRRPRVAEYLGIEGSIGLTDVLSSRATIDEAIVSWQRGLLDCLPCGAIPPNPSELLGSQQLVDVLTELKARYEMVVLDAPPLLPVTDAAILATAADGAILVTRYGQTSHEQAELAADSLRQVNARLFGTVLNFVPQKRRMHNYYAYERKGSGTDSGRTVLREEEVPLPKARN